MGDTVYVSCDEGFVIRGPEELECGADGTYREEPICVVEPTTCPAPEIENAIVSPREPIIEGKEKKPCAALNKILAFQSSFVKSLGSNDYRLTLHQDLIKLFFRRKLSCCL